MMELERACPTAAHWTEQQYLDLFRQDVDGAERLALAAELSSETPRHDETSGVAGFLVARNVAHEWELENILVAPAMRRKGLGKQLVDALLAHATETDSECVFLEVRESNSSARSLYEGMGFQQTGRRKSYYVNPLEDAILYRRSLR